MLEPSGRTDRPELAGSIDHDRDCVSFCSREAADPGDKRTVLLRKRRNGAADPDSKGLPRYTHIADVNVAIAGGKIGACKFAQGEIITACRVVQERLLTNGRVVRAGCVPIKCSGADRGIGRAGAIVKRYITDGRVEVGG